MAMLPQEAFDVELEEKKEYPPIPSGDYKVLIKESDIKETAKGGVMVALRFEIEGAADGLGTEATGRLLFDNINVINTGPKKQIVEQIGRRQLHDLLQAIGKPGSTDTNDMLGGRLVVRVKLTQNPDYPNEVSKYMPLRNKPSGQFTPPAPAPEAAAPAAAPAADPIEQAAAQPSAPWARAA